MKLATFFDKFELFADAPNAVAKMRELILELAVQGKLSNRLSEDSQDSEWQLFIRSFHETSEHSALEFPFEIPDEWLWTTLASIGDTKPRNVLHDATECAFIPMALIPAEYGRNVLQEVRRWEEIKKGFTHFQNGDVVLAKITPCFENGKSAVVSNLTGGKGAGTTELHVFRTTKLVVLPEYVVIFFKSRGFIDRGIPRMTGSAGQKRVPHDYFAHSPFPLPPLAEQKRIVAKVDELMALCDRLEVQLQERETQHAALARAALARFADDPTPANLELLFHPSFAIAPDDLRKTILTLAVRGKLVPQDASEAPPMLSASAVNEVAEKTAETEEFFAIPESWCWVTVSDVAEARLGKMLDKEKNRGKPQPYLRNTNVHWFRFELDSIKTMPFEPSEVDEYRLNVGDVLICEGGHGIARSAVWDGQIQEMMFQKALHRVRPLESLNGHFLTYCLWVYEREEILKQYYTGAGIPHFTGKSLARVSFPLPPLGEQRRIVAKVDELMALVDQLETQLDTARTTAEKLLEALVAELTTTD